MDQVDFLQMMSAIRKLLEPAGVEMTDISVSMEGFGAGTITIHGRLKTVEPKAEVQESFAQMAARGRPSVPALETKAIAESLGIDKLKPQPVEFREDPPVPRSYPAILEEMIAAMLKVDDPKTSISADADGMGVVGQWPPVPAAPPGKTVSSDPPLVVQSFGDEELVEKVKAEFKKAIGSVDNTWRIPVRHLSPLADHIRAVRAAGDYANSLDVPEADARRYVAGNASCQMDIQAIKDTWDAKCECGAHKANGAPRGPGHASYCPWSQG